ncbi:hypothetical protein R1flu_026858 [Riccia fluitans]|uniref:Methylated-DNA--protein-cysteine methyltransferase n=1 Tax=Riccia fluitans TaxID=41844 RepID=A0ABD1XH41_9MARC
MWNPALSHVVWAACRSNRPTHHRFGWFGWHNRIGIEFLEDSKPLAAGGKGWRKTGSFPTRSLPPRWLQSAKRTADEKLSASFRLKKQGLHENVPVGLKFSQVATPLGPVTLGVSDAGLHIAHFGTFGEESYHEDTGSGAASEYMKEAKMQLEEYFAGCRTTFSVPLNPEGTPFQKRAWAALAKILFGQTICYEEQAELMNEPGKARAVGSANGKNPICIFLPCHRVIAKGGKLGGFSFGLESKQFLLDLEQSKTDR